MPAIRNPIARMPHRRAYTTHEVCLRGWIGFSSEFVVFASRESLIESTTQPNQVLNKGRWDKCDVGYDHHEAKRYHP